MSNQNHVEALKAIAAMDPAGIRADDLGRAVRIAAAALTAPSLPSGTAQVAADGAPVAWVELTDEDRKRAFDSLPDMLDGFLKTWGWLHFAKAIEAICREKNVAPQPAAALTRPDSAAPAGVEHGELHPESALEQARTMLRYCDAFNGQKFSPLDDVDRLNLATALDNLQETAAMLLNMADRVAAAPKAPAAAQEVGEYAKSLLETLDKIALFLNIDLEAAKKAPGKPSDVYIAAIKEWAPQPPSAPKADERNFCERCGKRLFDGIHTCTPPLDDERGSAEPDTFDRKKLLCRVINLAIEHGAISDDEGLFLAINPDARDGSEPGLLREAESVILALLRDTIDYGSPQLIAKGWANDFLRKLTGRVAATEKDRAERSEAVPVGKIWAVRKDRISVEWFKLPGPAGTPLYTSPPERSDVQGAESGCSACATCGKPWSEA